MGSLEMASDIAEILDYRLKSCLSSQKHGGRRWKAVRGPLEGRMSDHLRASPLH